MTGFIGRVLFFSQPGQLGFQVAYPLVKTMHFGGHALVRPADVTEESLSHDVNSYCLGVAASMSSRAVANQVHCLWR